MQQRNFISSGLSNVFDINHACDFQFGRHPARISDVVQHVSGRSSGCSNSKRQLDSETSHLHVPKLLNGIFPSLVQVRDNLFLLTLIGSTLSLT
jgi:hypothetical protein